jgi:DNA-binding IscR family transcriptional regulator
MKEVRDATADILDNTTLADVNARLARTRRGPGGTPRTKTAGRKR